MALIQMLLSWAAIITSAVAGWKMGGWLGLLAGVVAGVPIAMLLVSLLDGLFWLACMAADRLAGPPDGRSFWARLSGTGRLMIVALAAALWLGAGLAMVRASKTSNQRHQAVALVVLGPIGIVAEVFIGRWVDRWNDPT